MSGRGKGKGKRKGGVADEGRSEAGAVYDFLVLVAVCLLDKRKERAKNSETDERERRVRRRITE